MIPLSTLSDIGNLLMTPFYWMISSILVFFHMILTPVFGTSNEAQGWVWLLAIILLTCVIRGIMLPLYAKQLNSQRAMTSMQPKMKEIQKKYAGDRQRQSAETMKLYQDAGISPYASCLPMLIQMPVFLSVYWTIRGIAYNWADARLNGLFAHYQIYTPNDRLPAPEAPHVASAIGSGMRDSFMNATIFGAKLSETFMPMSPFRMTQVLIVVLVVLMMGTLFYQQWYMMRRNMPAAALEGPMGQTTKSMTYVMPFMYLFSGAVVPMGILLYWLVSNVWTMMQQYVMVRIYPTPDTPAYAAWEDRMIAQGKDPVAIEKSRIDKARSKRAGGGLMAKMSQMAQKQAGVGSPATVPLVEAGEIVTPEKADTRPVVTRTDPETGKKVVVRQQPKKNSRAKRKH